MTKRKSSVVVPAIMIAVGTGWLLTNHDVIPGVNWIWVLGLAIAGILTLAIGGLDKATVVVGPFLIICTVLSILRQTQRISVDTEVPALVIVAGALMLVAHMLPLPAPKWLSEEQGRSTG
ncbi:MAG: hypothetical protein GY715_07805 [Planctomycetes bacterium]|nr:hypothetical protein [Planctomycetota bacterium]